MPNHVKNVLKFKNLKTEKDIKFILDTIAKEIPGVGPGMEVYSNYAIDFNKIIPEPLEECDCPDDCKVSERSHIEADKDRPWFDWYEWHNKYWGTKWNAYECYSKIGKTWITLVFNTAWNTPTPIIEHLHLMGYEFELKYADEDIGSNCGIVTYQYYRRLHLVS